MQKGQSKQLRQQNTVLHVLIENPVPSIMLGTRSRSKISECPGLLVNNMSMARLKRQDTDILQLPAAPRLRHYFIRSILMLLESLVCLDKK